MRDAIPAWVAEHDPTSEPQWSVVEDTDERRLVCDVYGRTPEEARKNALAIAAGRGALLVCERMTRQGNIGKVYGAALAVLVEAGRVPG
jgi:hypothetical protein